MPSHRAFLLAANLLRKALAMAPGVATIVAVSLGTSLTLASAGVVAWEPGVGWYRTTLGNISYPICNSNEVTTPYSAASFDAIVLDSGALACNGCPGLPFPPYTQGGASGAGWSLRLSADGVEASFNASDSYVPGSTGVSGNGLTNLSLYRFTLDAPTYVTLRVVSNGSWQTPPPTPEAYRAVFGSVWARVEQATGNMNLFPDFDTPPSGVIEQTQLLEAGDYKFSTQLFMGGWDYSETGSSWNEASQVSLQFSDPVVQTVPAIDPRGVWALTSACALLGSFSLALGRASRKLRRRG